MLREFPTKGIKKSIRIMDQVLNKPKGNADVFKTQEK